MKYQPKVKARDYQTKALRLMEGQRAFALLMAMRTGKTKVELDDFGRMELENEVNDQLVIAPAGVYRTWETAIKDHCSEDLQERMIIHTWRSGRADAAKPFMRINDPRRPRTLLMNVEALSRPGDARKLVIEYLSQRKPLTGVDESTIIKNPSAKRTKFIISEITPRSIYRRILTGLATPRSPLDLFSQFEFLDWNILGFRSYYAFRARYAIMRNVEFGGRWVKIVDGYRDVEELNELIKPHSFRVPFRPNIPPTYSIREVSLTKEQEKAYAEIKEFATTQLENGSHVTSTLVIDQMLRLHQILCGHVKDEGKVEHEIPENRTSELIELLEEYQGKAVIWFSYDIDLRKVSQALEKHFKVRVARFWGGNRATREEEEKVFKNDPNCPYMCATPDAGGWGRTWDNADLVIYYSSKNNLEHRDQSEQRVQGVDKKRPVDYVDLIVPNTVEGKFLHALRNKINMATTINGDNYREWLI